MTAVQMTRRRHPWTAQSLERLFAGVSAILFVARLYASRVLGFGDAEALYAYYVAHPAPAYVDHPGLVAVLGAIAGKGSPPTPQAAHLVTATLATVVPAFVWCAARLAGAPRKRAALAGLATALCPELGIGLFGLTPDLPFASFTLLTIGLVSAAVRAKHDSFKGDLALIAAGACAGLGALSKAPGLALVVWLPIATFGRRPAWLVASATALAAVFVSPVVVYELAQGWPMFTHRFVHTQQAAGFALRNVGALVGGQLAYVSPFLVFAALVTARALLRAPRRDPLIAALAWLALLFGVPLTALCLWSRVAEPHWIAPVYLPLVVAWARRPARATFAPWVARPLLPTGAALVVLVHLYVLTDLFPRLSGDMYEGRYDLANDMRLFPAAAPTLREAVDLARLRGPTLVVVSPHWTLSAQLSTVLPPGTRITTASSLAEDDDFVRWLPRDERDAASVVVWAYDDRFVPTETPRFLRDRQVESTTHFSLRRGGRVVRTLYVQTYGAARAVGSWDRDHAPHLTSTCCTTASRECRTKHCSCVAEATHNLRMDFTAASAFAWWNLPIRLLTA